MAGGAAIPPGCFVLCCYTSCLLLWLLLTMHLNPQLGLVLPHIVIRSSGINVASRPIQCPGQASPERMSQNHFHWYSDIQTYNLFKYVWAKWNATHNGDTCNTNSVVGLAMQHKTMTHCNGERENWTESNHWNAQFLVLLLHSSRDRKSGWRYLRNQKSYRRFAGGKTIRFSDFWIFGLQLEVGAQRGSRLLVPL